MKTKKHTDESQFKFWRENLKANEFTLTLKEIKEKYLAWLNTQDEDWILYYGHQTVNVFINHKAGLCSSTDPQTYVDLQDLLLTVRHSLPCYQNQKA